MAQIKDLLVTGVSRFIGKVYASEFVGKLTGNADTATKATQDSAGQQINTTYIKGLSVSGTTVTYTKGDGTTGTITTQDTNTDTKVTQTAVTASSYTNWRPVVFGSSNSSTEGFTPTSVTDVEYTTDVFSVQPSTGTMKATTFKGALSGNASTASTLATARTINGTSFNGSANITTSNWGTARNIYIADSDGTNTGSAVSVNGSANATLKLPATIKASLSGNASTATKATQDSAGQQINTTYIKGLSVSGKTITYTKGDGTTGTITTQDTNTTYSTGTASTSGLTKLYTSTGTATDGTMTQNAINTALGNKTQVQIVRWS